MKGAYITKIMCKITTTENEKNRDGVKKQQTFNLANDFYDYFSLLTTVPVFVNGKKTFSLKYNNKHINEPKWVNLLSSRFYGVNL